MYRRTVVECNFTEYLQTTDNTTTTRSRCAL